MFYSLSLLCYAMLSCVLCTLPLLLWWLYLSLYMHMYIKSYNTYTFWMLHELCWTYTLCYTICKYILMPFNPHSNTRIPSVWPLSAWLCVGGTVCVQMLMLWLWFIICIQNVNLIFMKISFRKRKIIFKFKLTKTKKKW